MPLYFSDTFCSVVSIWHHFFHSYCYINYKQKNRLNNTYDETIKLHLHRPQWTKSSKDGFFVLRLLSHVKMPFFSWPIWVHLAILHHEITVKCHDWQLSWVCVGRNSILWLHCLILLGRFFHQIILQVHDGKKIWANVLRLYLYLC